SPAGSSSLIAPSAPSASSVSPAAFALSVSPASSTPLGEQDQYQSILSRLENLPTQDQIQVYFIYDESIGEAIYARSNPVSCVYDKSFGGYGYGVAR
ncbi:hypothetical protein BGX29_003463, partial [Mortierella sp. GBA35]